MKACLMFPPALVVICLIVSGPGRAWAAERCGVLPVPGEPSEVLSVGDGAGAFRTIQEAVTRARPGSRVVVRPGVYRESVVVDKPLQIWGEPGATIKGSDVLTGFARDGEAWAAPYPYEWYVHGECLEASRGRCKLADQVFVDGRPQAQVLYRSALRPGAFYVGDGKLSLGQDPAGRLVEVSTRDAWIRVAAPDVLVRGLRMMHSRVIAQWGALTDGGEPRAMFVRNDLSLAHGAAIRVDGDGAVVCRNLVHHNGQIGIVGTGFNMRIVDNVIWRNNTEGFATGWEAGGAKFKQALNLRLEGNEVFDNTGIGLWCDIDCVDVVFRRNRVHHNSGPGIVFEISLQCRIEENRAWENGHGTAEWVWGAGILVQNSSRCSVRDNIVAWNATSGIAVVQQDRGPRWSNVNHNMVRRNLVASTVGNHVALVSDTGFGLARHRNRAVANRLFVGPGGRLTPLLEASLVPEAPDPARR